MTLNEIRAAVLALPKPNGKWKSKTERRKVLKDFSITVARVKGETFTLAVAKEAERLLAS